MVVNRPWPTLQLEEAHAELAAKKDQACLSFDQHSLRQLLETNIKMQCWDQVSALCQQLVEGSADQQNDTASLTHLAALSSVLTDRLAVDVETAASVPSSNAQLQAAGLLPKVHRELSAYRSKLLLSDSCLSQMSLVEDHAQVAQLCKPVEDILIQQPQHMLSLFSSMQALVRQQQVVLNQLQGQAKSVSCMLQPIHLRLADLITLLCPQFRQACNHLMTVQSNASSAMQRAQQVSKLDYNTQVRLVLHERKQDDCYLSISDIMAAASWLWDCSEGLPTPCLLCRCC